MNYTLKKNIFRRLFLRLSSRFVTNLLISNYYRNASKGKLETPTSHSTMSCGSGLQNNVFLGHPTLKICSLDAVIIFSDGNVAHVNVLNSFGISPGISPTQCRAYKHLICVDSTSLAGLRSRRQRGPPGQTRRLHSKIEKWYWWWVYGWSLLKMSFNWQSFFVNY